MEQRRRRQRTVFHYKVDHLLSPADAAAYAALLLEPRTTIDVAHAWLAARGYALSRSAVARHRRRFLASREEGRHKAREYQEFLRAVAKEAKKAGPEGFAEVLHNGHQLLLFKRLMDLESSDLAIREYAEIGRLINLSVRSQQELLNLQARLDQARRDESGPADEA